MSRGRGAGIAGIALAGNLSACAAVPAAAVATSAARAPAIAFPEDPRPWPRFRSKRMALSVPLPDGPAWRIDDHSGPALVATHPPTTSSVTLAVFRTDGLVGRSECEALARERKLVPAGELRPLETAVEMTQGTFDTKVQVVIEVGAGPKSPLQGHVLAFGGFLRKCYVFDFATRVQDAADEPILSARLAVARARILGGLELETLGAIPRESPALPR